MGWRFRKTFGRGPIRWTLSKRGIGWSWGIPGLRYGVSPSGQRYFSFGIPGTGLYYIKYFPMQPQSSQPAIPSANQNKPVFPKYIPPPTTPAPPSASQPQTNQQPWWRQKNLP
ncbi:MAG: DUF4236 domain-containing protein [Verrucomicrobiota bacterium]